LRDFKNTLGESAGLVWRALYERGPKTKDELKDITNLSDDKLNGAIGWLARENKIKKQKGNIYELDNTNLTPEIGNNAGKIYKVMDIWGEVDIPILKKLVNIDEEELYSALGWLAKEEKIKVDEKNRFNLLE